MNSDDEFNPIYQDDDIMEEVEQVEDGAPPAVVADGAPDARVVADGAPVARVAAHGMYLCESSYGERIRLLFAMALLGGLAGCVFGVMVNSELMNAVIDEGVLRIIMDHVTEPIYDDTPLLFSLGADLASERFDFGRHVPLGFSPTDVSLLTDFAKDPTLGVTLQPSVDDSPWGKQLGESPDSNHDEGDSGSDNDSESDEEFYDMRVNFNKMRVAIRHPHIDQLGLLQRSTSGVRDLFRNPSKDIVDPLNGKVLIEDVENVNYLPGSGNVSDESGVDEGGDDDNVVLYATAYFYMQTQLLRAMQTARHALDVCLLDGNALRKAKFRKVNKDQLKSLHAMLQNNHLLFDNFYSDFYALQRNLGNLTGLADYNAIAAMRNAARQLQRASRHFGELVLRSRDVLCSKERCSRCGNPFVGGGFIPGDVCSKCKRKHRLLRKEGAGGDVGGGDVGPGGGVDPDNGERCQHDAGEHCPRDDGEHCPQCGKHIPGEGGMPGAVCSSCWRKNREDAKRKREEDDGAGGAGGAGV